MEPSALRAGAGRQLQPRKIIDTHFRLCRPQRYSAAARFNIDCIHGFHIRAITKISTQLQFKPEGWGLEPFTEILMLQTG
jgi:hypothetical protein